MEAADTPLENTRLEARPVELAKRPATLPPAALEMLPAVAEGEVLYLGFRKLVLPPAGVNLLAKPIVLMVARLVVVVAKPAEEVAVVVAVAGLLRLGLVHHSSNRT